MKRQNFDASLYTTYLKKRANTMLLESGNFDRGKSIVSTPPSGQDSLSVSLRSEFEAPIIVQSVVPEPPPPPTEPVVPSVVTIIDDIDSSVSIPGSAYPYFFGSSFTVTWSCIPSAEVTLELYGARLNSSSPVSVIEPHAVRETIITSNTSHTFNAIPYGYIPSSYGTNMYIVITPSSGSSVTGNSVNIAYGS